MKTNYEMKYNYKNLFKDAHKLTRKVVLKFKNLNYKAQLIISIRFIIKEIKEAKAKIFSYNKPEMQRRRFMREINKLEYAGCTEATNPRLVHYKKKVEELRKLEKKEILKQNEEFNLFIYNLTLLK